MFVVLSRKVGLDFWDIEFIAADRSKADSERRLLSGLDRSRQFSIRQMAARELVL